MQLRGRRIATADHATEAAPHAVPRSNGLLPAASPPTASPPTASLPRLSPLWRLYLYSLHGCLCELLFTAAWEVCGTRDARLRGHSSVWTLPMYATALLALEALGPRLRERRLPLALRLAAYTALIYLWELTWGAALSLLGACPWDYSGFRYNFRGVVTLEYALFWAAAALIAEKLVIKNTLRIRIL